MACLQFNVIYFSKDCLIISFLINTLETFPKYFFSFFLLFVFSQVGLMSTSFYSGTALSRSVAEEALHFGGMDPLPLPSTASFKSRGGSSSGNTTRKKSSPQKIKKIKSRTKNNGGAFKFFFSRITIVNPYIPLIMEIFLFVVVVSTINYVSIYVSNLHLFSTYELFLLLLLLLHSRTEIISL